MEVFQNPLDPLKEHLALVRQAEIPAVAQEQSQAKRVFQFGDAVAICDDGIRNLITGQRGGANDPLAGLGSPDIWASELASLLSYPDSGDLIINGTWLEAEQKVVVLEEQTSSHGGLGGRQTEPFVVLPQAWSTSVRDFESPEALHGLIRRELTRYGHSAEE